MAIDPASSNLGYIEGYYGRLLDWSERLRLLDHMHNLGMRHYLYAPKEDPGHRRRWRLAYEAVWRGSFSEFAAQAARRGIRLIAGVAPGLDFDYAHIDQGADFQLLTAKCQRLLDDGAYGVALLLDDIDEAFDERRGHFAREGLAHAGLANALAQTIGQPIQVVPRAYAAEIAASAPNYWPDFATTIDPVLPVYWCGEHIVCRAPSSETLKVLAPDLANPVLIWDNLYANDYCPRRLYIGPWLDRPAGHVGLNPTGMVETDRLLLSLMADAGDSRHAHSRWQRSLRSHAVPEAFDRLSAHFYHPPFFEGSDLHPRSGAALPPLDRVQLEALDYCLWDWQGALAREWYPFLMGLKQDALLARGELPANRIWKTQTQPLARTLLTVIAGFDGSAET